MAAGTLRHLPGLLSPKCSNKPISVGRSSIASSSYWAKRPEGRAGSSCRQSPACGSAMPLTMPFEQRVHGFQHLEDRLIPNVKRIAGFFGEVLQRAPLRRHGNADEGAPAG
ncbi:hypothetical protein AM571_PC01303 (plasmid) [Rhizobium etli 8C-3]|uniref:Uncharacterized protein n=1 Tax=Rhizobium etli 8C-3 TaxID=538025 RepID=A0A1L5PGH2_RHIET|nr:MULTISPECIES: hypothetical protein [Rhizobium]APO79036.1 hypothetical protein AM571_PC01303 [Rhizobium etli 8C-3]